jgi:hypothetical protein
MRSLARLRLAALQARRQAVRRSLKTLDAATAQALKPWWPTAAATCLLAQGKPAEARAAYQAAYKAMGEKLDYRRLIEAKLTALGAAPDAEVAAPALRHRPEPRSEIAQLVGRALAVMLAACARRPPQAHTAGAGDAQDRRPPGLEPEPGWRHGCRSYASAARRGAGAGRA